MSMSVLDWFWFCLAVFAAFANEPYTVPWYVAWGTLVIWLGLIAWMVTEGWSNG